MAQHAKRRKELRNELSLIEKQIYDLETNYLEETKGFGNIFVGWNGYLAAEKPKSKKAVNNEERLFSLSSLSSPASRKEVAKAGLEKDDDVDGQSAASASSSTASAKKSNKRKEIDDIFLHSLDELEVEF
jgi:chromatin modification-related protein EAF6